MIKKLKPGFGISDLLICFVFVLVVLFFQPAYTQDQDADSQNDEQSEASFPEKIKTKSTLEVILDAPGKVAALPFKLMFHGIEWAAGKIYDPFGISNFGKYFTSADGLRALRPTYSSRSGAGLKLYQKNWLGEGSRLQIKASAGLNLRQRYRIEATNIRLFGGRQFTDIAAEYRKRVNEPFYGLGPTTRKTDRTSFTHEHTVVSAGWGLSIHPSLDGVASVHYEYNNVFRGVNSRYPSTDHIYDLSNLPGLENRLRLWGARVEFRLDSRNQIGGTTSGNEILFGGGISGQAGGDEYGFYQAHFDLKHHVHLFYGRTLVFRVGGEMVEPMAKRSVPFYHLTELGRRETIRGFSRGRFRDNTMILGGIEYHYPLMIRSSGTLEAFLFVDAGRVSNRMTDRIHAGDLQTGYGIGFRFWNPAEEVFNLTIGQSTEQIRFYFMLGL